MGFEDLADAEDANDAADETESVEDGETPDARTTPAFEFEETINFAQYVPEDVAEAVTETWELDAKRILTRELNIKNVEKREWQTAVQRLAMENPEMVVDLMVKAREERYGEIDDE